RRLACILRAAGATLYREAHHLTGRPQAVHGRCSGLSTASRSNADDGTQRRRRRALRLDRGGADRSRLATGSQCCRSESDARRLGRCGANRRDGGGELSALASETAVYHDPDIRRAAMVAHRGKRILAIEYFDARKTPDLSALKVMLNWTELDEVRICRKIPVD